MERELYNRLLKLIGEHHINLMEPKGLLEITIATLEAVKAYKIATGFYSNSDIQAIDQVSGVLRTCR